MGSYTIQAVNGSISITGATNTNSIQDSRKGQPTLGTVNSYIGNASQPYGKSSTSYNTYQYLCRFLTDSTVIPAGETITAATLRIFGVNGGVGGGGVSSTFVEAYKYNWGASAGIGAQSIFKAASTRISGVGASGSTMTTPSVSAGVGDFLIVTANFKTAANATLSISDTAGNTYTAYTQYDNTHNLFTVTWTAINIASSAFTVTVTSTQSASLANLVVYYIHATKPESGWSIAQNATGTFSGTTMTATFGTTPSYGSFTLQVSSYYVPNNSGVSFGAPANTFDFYNEADNGSTILLGLEVTALLYNSGNSATYTISPGTGVVGSIINLEIPTDYDFRPPSLVSADYSNNLQVATYDCSVGGGWSSSAYPGDSSHYNNFTSTANMIGAINRSGYTEFLITTTNQRTNSTNSDACLGVSAINSGDPYGNNSKLIVTTTGGAAPKSSTFLTLGVG